MSKQEFLDKYNKVILEFSEYENGTVTYLKELPNGDIIMKEIYYGDDIVGVSFRRNGVKRLSDIEPYPCHITFLPYGNPKGNLNFPS